MSDFTEIGKIDLNGNKKLNLLMQICFLVIAAIGAAIIFILDIPKNNGVSSWNIVLACFGYLIVHECIHILVMKLFSKEPIRCKFHFPTVAVGCDTLFGKTQFVIIAAAPVILLGGVISAFFFCLPQSCFLLISVLLTMNFAGASGDYVLIFIALKAPGNALFQDNSEITRIIKRNDGAAGPNTLHRKYNE